jgi:glutamine phosphoribosylpyrophosphate amidotransferase
MAVVDGCGMPVYNMPVYKKMGLVRQVLDKATLATHEGHLGVGQTLHSTTGGSRWEDAQPAFRTNAAGAGIAAARNGNLATTALAGHLISKVLTAADGLRSAITQPLTLPLSNP